MRKFCVFVAAISGYEHTYILPFKNGAVPNLQLRNSIDASRTVSRTGKI